MAEKKDITGKASELRKLAEQEAARFQKNTNSLSPEETQRVLHELRVHQIELEMQNEELRASQAELDAARTRYFDLYDLAPAGYFTISEHGIVLEANLTAATLLGEARPSLVKRPFSQFIIDEDQDIYYLHRNQLLETKEPQSFELRMLKKDGTVFWSHLETTTVKNADGAPACLIVICNISERKLMEKELRNSEARFRSYFDLPLYGIAITSPEKGWIEVNGRLCSMLGYSQDEILRMTWAEMTYPDDLAEDVEQFERMLSGQIEQYQVEKRFIRKDGNVIWINLAVGCVRQADGKVDYFTAVLEDITERKKMEEDRKRLESQNLQLQKAESLGRMAGAIAHHFNNQLHVVQGYLGMVIGRLPPGDSNIEQLATAMQASKKASDVSSLMITYLGQKQVKLELVDIAELCRMSLPILQEGKPGDVVLELDLPSPGPVIKADVKQIQQLLSNLAVNAFESLDDRAGTIRLSVKTVSPKDIPSSHRFPVDWNVNGHSYACLEVMDSGCGIQKADMDKLFEPFFSTKFTGRGLGLPVVLGIAKSHNGVITVANRIGGGTVFSVFFPLSAQLVPPQIDKVAKAPEKLTGGTVLLVEDEELVRKMTAMMLSNIGYAVLQAKDGIEAVEIFGQHKDEISCLLSDLTMPRMGGWETIAALRAMRHDLPVVLASGYDEASVMAGEHSELPDFFLNKPYDLHKLGDMIGQAIARKKERA